MPNYRRHYLRGPVFVTVVTHRRTPWLDGQVRLLLDAMRCVKQHHPYRHLAHAVMPDHLHWLLQPEAASDFSRIVGAVKRQVTWRLKETGHSGPFWQHRFYDHIIRDETDLLRHLDYIHYNPVRHGLALRPIDYPHSTFPEWVKRGYYEPAWGVAEPHTIADMHLE